MMKSWTVRVCVILAVLTATYCVFRLHISAWEPYPQFRKPMEVTNAVDPLSFNCGNVTKPLSSNCSHLNFTARRFALALHYFEQQTAASNNFFSMVNTVHYWNALAVVPFTASSRLFGLPSNSSRRKLDVLFDVDQLSTEVLCGKYKLPPLAPFDKFLAEADSSVVYIVFAWDIKIPDVEKKSVNTTVRFDCSHLKDDLATANERMLKELNTEAYKIGRHSICHFHITTHCCIDASYPINISEMKKVCSFTNTSTLIFNVWRGHESRITDNNMRLMIPELSSGQPSVGKDVIPCSKEVYSNVTAFVQSFSHGKDFIGIHLRTTKIGWNGAKYTNKCMPGLFEFRNNLTKAHPDMDIKYFVDYGEFGAGDGPQGLIVRPFIEEDGLVPLHYNPSKFGGLQDRGFVALVEKCAVAKARILVVVGGGSFQADIVHRMTKEPQSEKVYYVCTNEHARTVSVDIKH